MEMFGHFEIHLGLNYEVNSLNDAKEVKEKIAKELTEAMRNNQWDTVAAIMQKCFSGPYCKPI